MRVVVGFFSFTLSLNFIAADLHIAIYAPSPPVAAPASGLSQLLHGLLELRALSTTLSTARSRQLGIPRRLERCEPLLQRTARTRTVDEPADTDDDAAGVGSRGGCVERRERAPGVAVWLRRRCARGAHAAPDYRTLVDTSTPRKPTSIHSATLAPTTDGAVGGPALLSAPARTEHSEAQTTCCCCTESCRRRRHATSLESRSKLRVKVGRSRTSAWLGLGFRVRVRVS